MPSTERDGGTGRQLAHPRQDEMRLEAVLHALADPIRLSIVRDLADGHEDMACIAFDLPVSKSTSTHHFKVLREAGVIRQHYAGTSRMSRLRDDDLEALFPGLLPAVLHAAGRAVPVASAAGPSV
ncbi:HTH-type transcriptional regulator [Streptomyces sp. ADI96-02]|uniref:ArsR/SmtB family transcription factor n=1 Tax=unclassified Streptomyces TaxID=2593676 RepID=UPI000F55591E|nr:helix-turn-helix transcriptional regulator [Streptomyces sp. ADI96-02]RPK69091.1 HTH-type transcriptional regulator [Streptomyces sp. ADI96-02]